ncbi:unnamed protein product [Cylindrotheca closterium]|uniref:Uncharacterized protein n=1 Tax=Cylindrotheca closterium TaxID=2856 RepID=A0AAD2G2V3_9STRA|nr:unnamed protein product [Cylindrotheca closterium]
MVRIGQRELQALNIDTNNTQLPATSTTQPSGTRVTMSTAGNSTTNRNLPRVLQPEHLETSLVYILETVFCYSAGSILHLALDLYGCKCYLKLIGMDDADIDGLQYPVSQPCDANGDPQPDVLRDVPKPLKAYLHEIRGYVYHQETVLQDPVTLTNCVLIDPDDFAEEFDWGIKLDANLYPTLSDDKQWDSYRHNLEATCCTHGLKQVLDPKYQPTSLNEQDLFDRHQSFLYRVFVRTLLTDQGKKIVRRYNKTYDDQSIYRDLCKFYTQSIKATSTANTKLQWLTTLNSPQTNGLVVICLSFSIGLIPSASTMR